MKAGAMPVWTANKEGKSGRKEKDLKKYVIGIGLTILFSMCITLALGRTPDHFGGEGLLWWVTLFCIYLHDSRKVGKRQ